MHCKSYSHFFSKKFQHICISLSVNFNELLTNDIISFEQLGPDVFIYVSVQWNLDNSKSKGPNSFVWIIETLNNWGLKCIHVFKSGLQNDFESLRILNYWSLNYRGSTVCICTYSGTSIIQSPRDQTVLFELLRLNNWGLKCIHIFQLGLQNDFELLRILNYWSLNYRGSTVHRLAHKHIFLCSNRLAPVISAVLFLFCFLEFFITSCSCSKFCLFNPILPLQFYYRSATLSFPLRDITN